MTNNIINNHDLIAPDQVHDVLKKYMLVDGFDLVLDLEKSKKNYLFDSKSETNYMDFFSFFASSPISMNHEKLRSDNFVQTIGEAALVKPSNSDVYSVKMAEFVKAFGEFAKPEAFKYLFFISGGALAVENALKVAFDWKVRKNLAKGMNKELGSKIIHFKQAFHGRSGYTMSLTNTDPVKIKYFPKFDWPRIINPKIKFPLEENLDEVIDTEKKAIEQIHRAIADNKDDIAAIIIEPIQCEGGDNFFRKEFFEQLRIIADENEILLIFDEVQTGFGITGKIWAHEHYVQPDIVCFGKKTQVCGIMVSDRIDDVEDHCFKKSSRINSTWGGNLVDMVRSTKFIEIIKEENLIENARITGEFLYANLLDIQKEFPIVSQVRGKGLLCAFDLPTSELRNKLLKTLFDHKLIILGCGEKSVRFRPTLDVTNEIISQGIKIIKESLHSLGN